MATALPLQSADARAYNKWRIHYNRKADTDSVVTLKFTTARGLHVRMDRK